MSKMQYLLTGGLSSAGFIVPAPDFQISHTGQQGVMIECPIQRTDNDVLEWIASQRGGHWVMVIWKVTLGGVEKTMPNPHLNNRSLWAYLVRKV